MLRIQATSIVLALFGATAAAQGVYNDVTAQTTPGGSANNSRSENADFGDVDSDGDLDLVFADGGDAGNDQNRIWINQGGAQGGQIGTFSDKTSAQFPVISDTSRDIEFVDYDEDGDLDIYISNASTQQLQSNRWWTNTGGKQGGAEGTYIDETQARWIGLGGPGSSVAPNQVMAAGGFIDWSCDCDFADFDNDGDLDLLHTSYGSDFNGNVPTRLFLNDGDGFFGEWNPSGFQLTGSNLNDGSPALWAEGVQKTNTTKTDGTEADIALMPLDADFGDIDGDFDLDILHGSRNTHPRFFFNRLEETGTPVYRDMTAFVFSSSSPTGSNHYEQEMADMDNDGDLDVYMLNWKGNNDWYGYNDGNGHFSGWLEAPGENVDDNETDFVDYDNDGDMDVYISNFSGQDRLYRNNWIPNGTKTLTLLSNSAAGDLPSQIGLDADAADYDNDGDYDIIVTNDVGFFGGGSENRLLNNSTQITDNIAARIPNVESPSGVTAHAGTTVVRAHVYDNSPWYIASFNETWMEVEVDGFKMPDAAMEWSGGQVFRGELPGSYVGSVSYTVMSADEHGNTGVSAVTSYAAGGSKGLVTYGSATPWTGGTLSLTSNGPVAQGNSDFALMVGGGQPGGLALVLMSTAAQVPPLSVSGIDLNISPVGLIAVSLALVCDAQGEAVVALPIPNQTMSGNIYLQGFGIEGTAYHASAGLQATPTGPLP